ncbi:MAG: MBL fold metallo-hydrolase [Fibrobacterales bacterium]
MTYFRQFLSGSDHASDDPNARGMANFSYAIGCPITKQCMLIDPTWAPNQLHQLITKDGYTLTGIIATHHHFDHIGGSAYGIIVPGALELIKSYSIPLYCHPKEKPWVLKKTDIPEESIKCIATDTPFFIGESHVTIHHTPGHSPGGICIQFDDKLIVGDTLFHEGCGRTDLAGADVDTLLRSLKETILPLPDTLEVYCGHNYGHVPSMSLGVIKETNYIFQHIS